MSRSDEITIDFVAENGELFLVLYGFDPTMGGAISFRHKVEARTFAELQEQYQDQVAQLLDQVETGKGVVRVGKGDKKVLNDPANVIDALEADFDEAVEVLRKGLV